MVVLGDVFITRVDRSMVSGVVISQIVVVSHSDSRSSSISDSTGESNEPSSFASVSSISFSSSLIEKLNRMGSAKEKYLQVDDLLGLRTSCTPPDV